MNVDQINEGTAETRPVTIRTGVTVFAADTSIAMTDLS
jgi:hypothetical protein